MNRIDIVLERGLMSDVYCSRKREDCATRRAIDVCEDCHFGIAPMGTMSDTLMVEAVVNDFLHVVAESLTMVPCWKERS